MQAIFLDFANVWLIRPVFAKHWQNGRKPLAREGWPPRLRRTFSVDRQTGRPEDRVATNEIPKGKARVFPSLWEPRPFHPVFRSTGLPESPRRSGAPSPPKSPARAPAPARRHPQKRKEARYCGISCGITEKQAVARLSRSALAGFNGLPSSRSNTGPHGARRQTSWERNVSAGTATGAVREKQSASTYGASKTTWNAWAAPVRRW